METLSVRTGSRTEFVDITSKVNDAVAASGVQDGFCMVYVPHTTAGVTVNENADPSVRKDILKEMNKVIPFEDNYSHMEGNSAAHIKSSLVGCSCMVPIEDGRLKLGTWQGMYFCEFDGGRSRKVWVTCK
ncbi:MAG: secondary thiamine-phosphate synthase enzyme YjbQ [Candidatus Brocadiia bacterium]